MTEPTKLGPFLGINNKLPTEKLAVPQQGSFVRDAVNVDITSAGSFRRRGGHTLVRAAAQHASSLWGSSSGDGYYLDGQQIMKFDGATAVTVDQVVDPGAVVSYTDTARGVVWTDGAVLRVIDSSGARDLAVPTPNPLPVATAATGGALAAGAYAVAYASVLPSGERSVVSAPTRVVVGDSGRIAIAIPNSPLDLEVYVSALNGSLMFRQMTVAAGIAAVAVNLVTAEGITAPTEIEAPMPAGTFVRTYRGRLLVAHKNYVAYSLPYNFGLTRPVTHFLALSSEITLCEPTQTGVFLATADETFFLAGEDITSAPLKPIAPYGAVPNTVVYEPNNLNMWWMTPRGLVRTTDANEIEMKQDANIAFPTATMGAGLYREEGGLTQVISVLTNATPTVGAAASSYMDAEVIK